MRTHTPVHARLGLVKSRNKTIKKEKNGEKQTQTCTERQHARHTGEGFYNNCQGLCRCVLNV